jgi:uroporphyrin-III C-methyltransferase
MTGTVYLVGAGPGAADLITVRGARLLAEADIVLHDALVGEEVLALAPRARHYNVGKRAGRASVDQRFICRLLVRMGLRHRVVVRLKGGDPLVFARANEEIAACRQAGVPVVLVPGISAGFAAAAALGTSLTERGRSRSVTLVTPSAAAGASRDLHWADAAAVAETALVYMGASHALLVKAALIERGVSPSRPIAIIESVSLNTERIIRGTLQELPDLVSRLGDGPALLVIGDVAARASNVALAQASAA